MGSADGIRFHLQATHTLTDEVLDGLLRLQKQERGVTGMQALANIHGAFHAAAAAVNAGGVGAYLCTTCGIRKAVVILTDKKLCAPCALAGKDMQGVDHA
jgi:hypothetical protein